MSDWYEGQEVLHIWTGNRYGMGGSETVRRTTPVRIAKIGRTLAHVDHGHGRLETYRLDGGWATRDFGGRIATQEMLDAEDARDAALKRLRDDYGWYRQGGRKKLPEDAVLRVVALLDELAAEVDQ